MEYADLECKEVLTLESLASEMTRMHHTDHNHALESLLNYWKQGCDATVIAETARKMLDACTGVRETEDTCMSDLNAAGSDDLDAAGFSNLDAAGFSDFYGNGHEDPPRTGHEDLSSACPWNAGACGSAAAGIAAGIAPGITPGIAPGIAAGIAAGIGTDITAYYRSEHSVVGAARG